MSGGVHFHGVARTTQVTPRQLPADVRGFVNRTLELSALDRLAGEGQGGPTSMPVIVVAGTAGVGKTSLAVHWAHRVSDQFPDGQLYVNLRGYDPGEPIEASQVLDRFLGALGVAPEAIPPDEEARAALYRTILAGRRVLVVLDNAKNVDQVRPLLPGGGSGLVLITSRTRMSGLISRDGAVRVPVEVLPMAEAVSLLRATTAGYRAGDGESDIIELAELCARLPLALRIAAERAAARPHVPLADLIEDLRSESSLWEALSAEDGSEADAVHSVFAWSYRALPPDAADVFRLLGLHPGPDFSVAAAAAVSGLSVSRARRVLDFLVGTYLLEQTGPDRFQFHDLLRAYAVDQVTQIESAAQRRSAVQRLVTWHLHAVLSAVGMAQDLFGSLDVGPPPSDVSVPAFTSREQATAWCELELLNLLGATRLANEYGLDDLVWQLTVGLFPISHVIRRVPDEWLAMCDLGLPAARRAGARGAEGELLRGLGLARTAQFRWEEAVACLETANILFVEVGDLAGQVRCVNNLGFVFLAQRDLPKALESFQRTHQLAGMVSDRRWLAIALINIGVVLCERGEVREATDFALRALAAQDDAEPDPRLRFDAMVWLARCCRESGDLGAAARYLDEARAIAETIATASYAATVALESAEQLMAAGEPAEAMTAFQEATVYFRRSGDRSGHARAVDGAGAAFRVLGRPADAVDFHRSAVELHAELRDGWHQAAALERLAAALDEADGRSDAERCRRAALELLVPFDDPRTERLRQRINAGRNGAEPGSKE